MKGVIHVRGIVQGVGFRPFIYRLAQKYRLKGYVLNMGNYGVEIGVEGGKKTIEQFIAEIRDHHPVIARINDISVKWSNQSSNYQNFQILKSVEKPGDLIVLPPDIAICEDCLAEFQDPSKYPDRYYHYPFIACSVCGPRYTTVIDLPYDRPLTTMKAFPFCEDCAQEYANPNDRRYHAQTYACRNCGPQFTLHDNTGEVIEEEQPFKEAANFLAEGKILALMGIGGVHLVCIPDDDVINELRKRKRKRKYKPFAVMAPSLEKIRTFAIVTSAEETLLTSYRRPILLLRQSENYYLSKEIAPGLRNIGVFLPYSGIHYLLFQDHDFPALIMTSGNISNLPMAIERENVVKELNTLADMFLLHNRPIYQRVDDSVVRLVAGTPTIIRRSRGYVPEHIEIPFDTKDAEIMAVGPELHSTGAALKKSRCFPTQHIGDVTSLELLDFLESAVTHLMKLLRIRTPSAIVCDKNPVFLSSQLARRKCEEYNCDLYQIQHHHAHLLGLMAEHKLDLNEEIIGIALDGVGYGKEGEVWGGEIFRVKYDQFISLAQLELQPLPGGDRCVYYPVRMLAAILAKKLEPHKLELLINTEYIQGLPYKEKEAKSLFYQLYTKKVPFFSSGMGRVLDALSALLHICYERTYEGEPAIRLEHIASQGEKDALKFTIPIKHQTKLWIDTTELMLQAYQYLQRGEKIPNIAASAIHSLARRIATLAIELAEESEIKYIGFSGGVAYNELITQTIKKQVNTAKLTFLQHRQVPPGDAGVSVGQCIYGARKLI